MIFPQTILRISDNSGGKFFKCIKILKKGTFTKKGKLGDVIVGSVQTLRSKNRHLSKVKKGDVVYGLIVRTKTPSTRKIGINIRFSSNDVVLVNKSLRPIASRVFGVLPKELRLSKFAKIISISNGLT
jgi:large subunit ribosomal protein L14